MLTAEELVKRLDMDSKLIFEPIHELLRSNKINIDEHYDLINHVSKVINAQWKHGYWKGIHIVKGDEFVEKTLGDGRVEGE
jgi:hypothetical protein